MIVVTGAAGFIGSVLISRLNKENYNHIVAVDKFDHPEKNKNLAGNRLLKKVDRSQLGQWIDENGEEIEFIFHIGARTDTSEFNKSLLWELNTDFTKMIWEKCIAFQIPLVYASSAATYGVGEYGYKDDESTIKKLKPLNPYGESKHEFDLWALDQKEKPFFWAGLKFFNVYGPNEYHKGRMASVVYHAYNQIKETGKMRLFRSHNPQYNDGEQMRDFIYVMDLVDVLVFLMKHRKNSGIFNLGTGTARTFLDLVTAVFEAQTLPPSIEFIDTPKDIRDTYQYYTEADMSKLRSIGYSKPFTSLESGVKDYVTNYLLKQKTV
ncbi:ADP-glyceromanno-heptose 6-epimerase [Roseivirga sp. BDSF3-8]|uniref:ADP-glyceromanno-heptose 6-epimerase n=1 Tax=Roseivirga sp. BDSF3-8 TaxID=3241598 RepID=UPI003531C65D